MPVYLYYICIISVIICHKNIPQEKQSSSPSQVGHLCFWMLFGSWQMVHSQKTKTHHLLYPTINHQAHAWLTRRDTPKPKKRSFAECWLHYRSKYIYNIFHHTVILYFVTYVMIAWYALLKRLHSFWETDQFQTRSAPGPPSTQRPWERNLKIDILGVFSLSPLV